MFDRFYHKHIHHHPPSNHALLEKIMSDLSKLKDADVALGQRIDDFVASIPAAIATAVAAAEAGDQAAIDAVTADLQADAGKLAPKAP